jgi:hypothetical protein
VKQFQGRLYGGRLFAGRLFRAPIRPIDADSAYDSAPRKRPKKRRRDRDDDVLMFLLR